MTDRPTPRVDRWKTDLRRSLHDRGTRTRLAEWLEQRYGSTVDRWKVQIAKILNGSQIPDGEFVLAVNAWSQSRRGGKNCQTQKRGRNT